MMDITLKLQTLMKDMNLSAVARRAEINPNTLYSYLHRGTIPSYRIAMTLARALGVDPSWMLDDAKGLPPVRVEHHDEISATTKVAA